MVQHDDRARGARALALWTVAQWNAYALPALMVTVGAACLAAVGIGLRARGRAPRIAGALVVGALVLLLVSAALSILGTLSLGLVAAGIIVGAWTLAATGERGRPTGVPETVERKFSNDVDPGDSRSTP